MAAPRRSAVAARSSSHSEMPVEEQDSLGQQWEACRAIRSRLRENDWQLVKWVKPTLVNKPTMAGIALNAPALTALAKWWCPQVDTPKSPSVLDLKKQAHSFSQNSNCLEIQSFFTGT